MEFDTRKFAHALDIASMTIENRNTIPILGCALVRLKGTDTALAVRGTDLDIQIEARAPHIYQPADAAFNVAMHAPKRVARLIRAAGDTIRISPTANDAIRLQGGPLDATIGGLPGDDFPAFDIDEPDRCFTAQLGFDGIDAILRTALACSTEETRYYLNGVYLHYLDGWTYRAVATDGHRLHVADIPLPGHERPLETHISGPSSGIIIPRKVINILRTLRPRMASDQPITIQAGPTRTIPNDNKDLAPEPKTSRDYSRVAFRFHAADIEVDMISKLIDGTFPDYTRVVPKHDPAFPTISVKRAALAGALDALAACSLERTKAVTLVFDPAGKLHVSAKWIDFSAVGKISLDAQTNVSAPFEISYNGKYLRQVCDASGGEDLVINVSDPAAPGLITNPAASDFQTVLMPMRI